MKSLSINHLSILLNGLLCLTVPFGCTPTHTTGPTENKGVRPVTSFEELAADFPDPDMIYAPFAFWFWDARLDTTEVAEMAGRMCDVGLNPGYAHARHGLPHDEWLSPIWFKSFRAALDSAKAASMYLGFCDEYWWPSGRADGRVLREHPELQAISLKWECIYATGGQAVRIPPSFFAVAARLDNSRKREGDLLLSRSLAVIGEGKAFTWTAPEGDWKIYVFQQYFHPGWDGGDVNYLDKRLAREFIGIAHKPYLQLKADLGTSVPGVFVDHEGDYGWKLAWSADLAVDYKKKKGKDIRQMIPLMIDKDTQGTWVRARYDWYDVVSDIYAGDFFGAVSRYLDSLGMYAISNLWEESLFLQAVTLGDAFKAHRAVSLPGNDCLFEKGLQVHDFKEIQSITEFEGRRFQSEVLGAQGWQMTPLLMKQVANAVTCWGVSHVVPHGINLNRALDSIPFPADWYTSNPYWPYLRQWNDFVRRASFINSHGFTAPDVLVLNPMGSIWPLLGGEIFHDTVPDNVFRDLNQFMHLEDFRKIRDIDLSYSNIINELTDQRIEFLIADEHYLQQMKVVGNGILQAENHQFTSVVLPNLFCLQKETARVLLDHLSMGGRVYYYGELPAASEETGLHDPDFQSMVSEIRTKATKLSVSGHGASLALDIRDQFSPQITFIKGDFQMYQLHRIIDGRHFFWLVNNTGKYRECTLRINGLTGKISKWDCEDGSIHDLASENQPGGSTLPVVFKPYEAFWLVLEEDRQPTTTGYRMPPRKPLLSMEGNWSVKIDPAAQPEPFKNQVSFPEYIVMANGERPLTPWESWGLEYLTGYVDYENDFMLDALQPGKHYYIDLGDVRNTAEVWINGSNAGGKMWPPFEFDITDLMVAGKNHVMIRVGNTMYNVMRYYNDKGLLHNTDFVTSRFPDPNQIRSGMFGPVKILGTEESNHR